MSCQGCFAASLSPALTLYSCPSRSFIVPLGRSCASLLVPKKHCSLCFPLTTTSMSIGESIKQVLKTRYGESSISRVIESFDNALRGNALEHDAGTPRHQRAESSVRGLKAVPFHSIEDYPWLEKLAKNWEIVYEELQKAIGQKDLAIVGNNVWAGPVAAGAEAYGPEWKTLVLKDRAWDETNSRLFPRTRRLLEDTPAVEVFFARQGCESGIASHSDGCNFLLTAHLALILEEQKAWIEVGGDRQYWEQGKILVFDTSFFHNTRNESRSVERYVLLIRFWHPELTEVERNGLEFIFKAIENPDIIHDEQEGRSQTDSWAYNPERPSEKSISESRAVRRKTVKRKFTHSKRPRAKGFGR